MGRDCSMREVLNVPLQKEADEFELSLELSIGGNYGKLEKPGKIEEKIRDPFGEIEYNDCGISSSDASCDKNDMGQGIDCGFLDLHKKKEIQALRRQKTRKKREDKLHKSRGLNAGGFVEDKLFLETQKFQFRVQDREIREKEKDLVDLGRKKEKNGIGEDLNLSLFNEHKETQLNCSRYVPNGNMPGNPFVVPLEGEKNERIYKNEKGSGNLSMDYDSGLSNGKNVQGDLAVAVSSSNGYLERSSSAVSHYRGTSQKGVSTSDSGSHSSGLSSHQDKNHPTTDHPFEQLEGNDSSSPTEPRVSRKVCKLSEDSSQTKNKRSASVDPTSRQTKEASGDVIKQRPPRPSNQNQVSAHMPCVSTKGNGPNGRTIMGFLYKYTKSEISIMCVCHGKSFSPVGFVEHAGCVDIENPLRHITVVPTV